ncbi:unnamed protein product [Protopolystoma xenopodis]|uniref:Uncharacterized protein n=1 Tax=Protopolystoma xenopodis TaxID=117903 RepID=A0A3S5B8Q0_9PLAT|nr:unnamed protein product [Protopolystoma xenopodis]
MSSKALPRSVTPVARPQQINENQLQASCPLASEYSLSDIISWELPRGRILLGQAASVINVSAKNIFGGLDDMICTLEQHNSKLSSDQASHKRRSRRQAGMDQEAYSRNA